MLSVASFQTRENALQDSQQYITCRVAFHAATRVDCGKTVKQGSSSQDAYDENDKISNLYRRIYKSRNIPLVGWLYHPDKLDKIQKWETSRKIGPGLINLGNTCFLNSILQCLSYTPVLANWLLTSNHTRKCKAHGFCMLCFLEKHVKNVLVKQTRKRCIAPKYLVQRITNLSRQFRRGRQADAHELFCKIMESCEASCIKGAGQLRLFCCYLVHSPLFCELFE